MIGNVIIVRKIKNRIKSFIFKGSFDPNKSAPTSDIYINWVTDSVPMTNLVISLSMPLPKIAGRNISANPTTTVRSEEHTSELQSRGHLVCRLLLEKKKKNTSKKRTKPEEE